MKLTLTEIFLRYRASLTAQVAGLVRDRTTAEDIVQETFIRLYEADETRTIHSPRAFISRVARNIAFDQIRHRDTRDRHETRSVEEDVLSSSADGARSAEQLLIERERTELLEAALMALPERARLAWRMSQVDGYTYEQIAKKIGVSRNTVYNDIKLVVGHCHDTLSRHLRE